jgi:uncharacterized membrane protein
MQKDKFADIENLIIEDLKKEEFEIQELKKHIESIKMEVDELHSKVCLKEPKHFSSKNIAESFFGALLIGFTFVFKGLLIDVSINLPWSNIIMIIFSTILILAVEIYFIGYRKVQNKKERKLGQFMFKRMLTMYLISLFVSSFLLFIFGFLSLVGTMEQYLKLIFVVAMPCAVGSVIPNMLKK